MSAINFIKAVASGNDFIIIDKIKTRNAKHDIRYTKLAKFLCQRKLSIGADGLLLIEPSQACDFKMRIFNPDGTEVEMCGNGSRCVALYAQKSRIVTNSKMTIETKAGNLQAEVKQDRVKVKMPDAKGLRLKFDLELSCERQNVNFINTGVAHVVCFVQGLNNFNVCEIGRAIRYHPEFRPEGANADFVEVLGQGHIRVRTYERGVEQETLACGTGVVAAAIIATYNMRASSQGQHKIRVDTQGGETLTVYFDIDKDKINQVYLEGRAKIIYQGSVYL